MVAGVGIFVDFGVGFAGLWWSELSFLLICGRFCWFFVAEVGFFVDLW